MFQNITFFEVQILISKIFAIYLGNNLIRMSENTCNVCIHWNQTFSIEKFNPSRIPSIEIGTSFTTPSTRHPKMSPADYAEQNQTRSLPSGWEVNDWLLYEERYFACS